MKTYRWGILSTGKIANTFASAVNFAENAELYACSSRTMKNAKAFAEKYGVKVYYDDYRQLARDENVDVIYIASPMAQHYEHARECLMCGKNVLCEKTVTVTRQQLDELLAIAKEKNVFFMEAMWMKFLPSFLKAKEWVAQGRIGNVKMIKCDFTSLCPYDETNRLFIPSLGGGSLFDLGVYPITLTCEFLGYTPEEIYSNVFVGKTGVDFDASIILKYKDAFAHLSCGFDMENNNPAFILGDKGRIRFGDWFFCTADVMLYDDNGNMLEHSHTPHPHNGYEFEIYEVHRCLEAGKKQSDINPHAHTVATFDIMDKCLKQWGISY